MYLLLMSYTFEQYIKIFFKGVAEKIVESFCLTENSAYLLPAEQLHVVYSFMYLRVFFILFCVFQIKKRTFVMAGVFFYVCDNKTFYIPPTIPTKTRHCVLISFLSCFIFFMRASLQQKKKCLTTIVLSVRYR